MGGCKTERGDQRLEQLADLGDDGRQLVDERDRRVDQGDAGRSEHDDGDDRRGEVRDRDRDASTAEWQMALDQRDERLKDVGQEPGDEQDDRGADQDAERLRGDRDDKGPQGEDDQPEDQARLAPRHDVGEGVRP